MAGREASEDLITLLPEWMAAPERSPSCDNSSSGRSERHTEQSRGSEGSSRRRRMGE